MLWVEISHKFCPEERLSSAGRLSACPLSFRCVAFLFEGQFGPTHLDLSPFGGLFLHPYVIPTDIANHKLPSLTPWIRSINRYCIVFVGDFFEINLDIRAVVTR